LATYSGLEKLVSTIEKGNYNILKENIDYSFLNIYVTDV